MVKVKHTGAGNRYCTSPESRKRQRSESPEQPSKVPVVRSFFSSQDDANNHARNVLDLFCTARKDNKDNPNYQDFYG
jgi:hypothetical protein